MKDNMYSAIDPHMFLTTFINALKRQLEMGQNIVNILVSPDFAERLVEVLENNFDDERA